MALRPVPASNAATCAVSIEVGSGGPLGAKSWRAIYGIERGTSTRGPARSQTAGSGPRGRDPRGGLALPLRPHRRAGHRARRQAGATQFPNARSTSRPRSRSRSAKHARLTCASASYRPEDLRGRRRKPACCRAYERLGRNLLPGVRRRTPLPGHSDGVSGDHRQRGRAKATRPSSGPTSCRPRTTSSRPFIMAYDIDVVALLREPLGRGWRSVASARAGSGSTTTTSTPPSAGSRWKDGASSTCRSRPRADDARRLALPEPDGAGLRPRTR